MGLIAIVSVINIKNMLSLDDLICVADIVFLIFALYFGYSAIEYLKLRVLENSNYNIPQTIKNNAFTIICINTILLSIFFTINYAFETIPMLILVNNDNYISKLNILPIIVLSYSFIIHLRLFISPSYLFDLVNRNIKTDYLKNFAFTITFLSTIVLIICKFLQYIPINKYKLLESVLMFIVGITIIPWLYYLCQKFPTKYDKLLNIICGYVLMAIFLLIGIFVTYGLRYTLSGAIASGITFLIITIIIFILTKKYGSNP